MSKEVSQEAITLAIDLSKRANDFLLALEPKCSPSEFVVWKRRIGKVLGEVHFEVLIPVRESDPELFEKYLGIGSVDTSGKRDLGK
jgi:hypothetical protein